MTRNEYSASMTKLSFWFLEFKRCVQLLGDGHTFDEIKKLSVEENIFSASTQTRATQTFNNVSHRIKSLHGDVLKLFERSDVSTQKVINLISIMQTDKLFFEFVYEVYREKLILGSNELTDSDIRIFFKNKQLQSEKVAAWMDYTLERLGACYKTMLMEAGVTDRAVGSRQILKPILDRALEDCLKVHGMEVIIHALTGVR